MSRQIRPKFNIAGLLPYFVAWGDVDAARAPTASACVPLSDPSAGEPWMTAQQVCRPAITPAIM
jgi:hypothetical protein